MTSPRPELQPPSQLNDLIEAVAFESIRSWAAWPQVLVRRRPELTAISSSLHFSVFNAFFGADLDEAEAGRWIDRSIEIASRRSIATLWHTGPATRPASLPRLLADRGFSSLSVTTGMGIALADAPGPPDSGPGLELAPVREPRLLALWNRTMTEIFEFPDEIKPIWLEMHLAMGLAAPGKWRHFLASFHGRPVATASTFLGEDVALLANVGVIERFRRQGLGTAIALLALDEAKRAGYRLAVLCSTEMGQGAYQRIGFSAFAPLASYLWYPP